MRLYTKFKLFKEHLSYDEMELTGFDHKFIVGRWFASGDDAFEYLKKSIEEYKQLKNDGFYKGSDDVTIDDYIVDKKEGDTSLKPYRLYRKPTEMESKRKEASDFIKKYGIISSPDLRYITHPLYAYVKYEHINKLKELGVRYTFKPIKEINFNPILQRYFKENNYGSVLIQSNIIRFFSLPSDMSGDYIKKVKVKVNKTLENFNNINGTDYFIKKTNGIKTDDTIRRELLDKLDDSIIKNNSNFDIKYKEVLFSIERGDDEDEFLAIVEMESLEKPKML